MDPIALDPFWALLDLALQGPLEDPPELEMEAP